MVGWGCILQVSLECFCQLMIYFTVELRRGQMFNHSSQQLQILKWAAIDFNSRPTGDVDLHPIHLLAARPIAVTELMTHIDQLPFKQEGNRGRTEGQIISEWGVRADTVLIIVSERSVQWKREEPVWDGAKDLLSPDVPATQPEEDGGEERGERQRGKGSKHKR